MYFHRCFFHGVSCQPAAGCESFVSVGRNQNGRPRKFCSDKCRYDFWNYEKRHKAEKMEMEVRLSESSRAKGAAGRHTETG